MYPIGQMHGTYILAQNENGLYIIDQHAAQERIKYEYFREKVGEVESEVQDLIVPLTFHYSKNEALMIDQHMDELAKRRRLSRIIRRWQLYRPMPPDMVSKGEETTLIEEIIQQVLDDRNDRYQKTARRSRDYDELQRLHQSQSPPAGRRNHSPARRPPQNIRPFHMPARPADHHPLLHL